MRFYNPAGPTPEKPLSTPREAPPKCLTLKFVSLLSFLSRPGTPLEDRIPGSPLALDDTLDIARHPTAIEVTGLGLGALAVDIALPRGGIEGKVALDGLVALCGLVVGPDSVGDGLGGGNGAHDGVVCRSSLPLAEGRARGGRKREAHERGGNVVSCRQGGARVSGRFAKHIFFTTTSQVRTRGLQLERQGIHHHQKTGEPDFTSAAVAWPCWVLRWMLGRGVTLEEPDVGTGTAGRTGWTNWVDDGSPKPNTPHQEERRR